MKTEIITSKDKETTIVVLKTKLGDFDGVAYFNSDEDPFGPSTSIGVNIAEARAYINYYKAVIREKKAEVKGLDRLLSAMPFDTEGYKYALRLKKAIMDEWLEAIDGIDFFNEQIKVAIESRQLYVKSRSSSAAEKEQYLKNLGAAISSLKEIKDK